MPNADILKKNPMPMRDGDVRKNDFLEVETGYTPELAIAEAKRCINCVNRPCVGGCPVGVDIPEFIAQIAEENFSGAYDTLLRKNSLPAVCGRVCPQENQCEARCIRGIKGEPVGIGRLERFAADCGMAAKNENPESAIKSKKRESKGKVAIVGSGPAGLSCAGELSARGYDVTVYEAFHKPGGVLVYGIPAFRLPKDIVEFEIAALEELGVKIEKNVVIGRSFTVDELLGEMGFDAVFVASGAGLPSMLGVPGENLIGVYSANEFLTRVNLMKAYDDRADTPVQRGRNVAVVGGGNVAMDAARCAKRLGAENVTIVYRRGREELPARRDEIHHAEEEGIEFNFLTAPLGVVDDGNSRVAGLECIRMELGEPDEGGRRRPIPIEGSEYVVPCDMVICAIGQSPNPLIKDTTPEIETNRWGCIMVADDYGQTTKTAVFAGGDAVTGAATVILAMGSGKLAAEGIDKYVSERKIL